MTILALTPAEAIARQHLAELLCADRNIFRLVYRATVTERAAYQAALDGGGIDAIAAAKVALIKAELEVYNNATKSKGVQS